MGDAATKGITGTHLVGSVPRPDTEAVFRHVLNAAPGRLKRITDGETGDRQVFTVFQAPIFSVYPPMMTKFVHNGAINEDEFTPEQVDEGIEICRKASLETGYDKVAIESYAVFRKLRDEGTIPKGVKFQVCLPTLGSVIMPFVQRAFQLRIEPIYEESLFKAMRKIQDQIPHNDLAIQLDIAADTAFWEALNPDTVKENSGLEWYKPWWQGDVKSYFTNYLVRQIAQVDEDVEVGLHNCYGDMHHRHWHEPASLAVVVERAQWIYRQTPRKINWFHCPVPKSAESFIDKYLAPLNDLLPLLEQHGTELYLGLVHEYKPELTSKYIEAAKKVVHTGFGIAAECGGGRMDWPAFEDMLKISADESDPVL